MRERKVSGEGTPKRGITGEGAEGPFTKGLRSYIQEGPWPSQGRARAVLSNHGSDPRLLHEKPQSGRQQGLR